MAKCNHLTSLPFKGLSLYASRARTRSAEWYEHGESKTNAVRFGHNHVVRSIHIAQHATLEITKEN